MSENFSLPSVGLFFEPKGKACAMGAMQRMMVPTPSPVNMSLRMQAQKITSTPVAIAKYGSARVNTAGIVKYCGLNLPPKAERMVSRYTTVETTLMTFLKIGPTKGKNMVCVYFLLSRCDNIVSSLRSPSVSEV